MAQAKAAENDDDVPLEVTSRRKWKAMATLTPKSQRVKHPVDFVRFIDTSTDDKVYDDCLDYMREVQKFRMFNGETDIPFNFVIGSDNRVYEGVGWKVEIDRSLAFKYLFNNCIDIGFIGDCEDGFLPTYEMFSSAFDVIKYGIKNKYISPTFKIIPLKKWRPSFPRINTNVH